MEDKAAEINRWHMDRGWSGIGYHFIIDRDGKVAAGRPIEKTGAHVRGHNTGTIGISLVGGHGGLATDKFQDHFTMQQFAALQALVWDLQERYGRGITVHGHNEYAAKGCPCFKVSDYFK